VKPIAYHSNLFALGTLSGTYDSVTNPVRRIADGSINLPYTLASGATPTGQVLVTLTSAQLPEALAVPYSPATMSGLRFILESGPAAGGPWTTVLDVTQGDVDRFVEEFTTSGQVAWRLTVSGTPGLPSFRPHEVMLAFKVEFPRTPQVGVARTRVRQYTRLPIPGGQPFVKRDGPRLRRTRYVCVAVSGSEVASMEELADALEGGQAFYFVDDLAQEYFAEMPEAEINFEDAAGVYTIQPVVLEVRADQ
jgi:hypothetical protein